MSLIDLHAAAAHHETRSRAIRRPAVMTLIVVLIALMIVRDVLRRRQAQKLA